MANYEYKLECSVLATLLNNESELNEKPFKIDCKYLVNDFNKLICERLMKHLEDNKSTSLFNDCLSKGVVFVTGRTFDPESVKDNHLRLSFSNMPKELIEDGVVLLASVIEKHLEKSKLKSSK